MTTEEFYKIYSTNQNDFLEHHGILGQRWGVRRFQNKDGSLTPEGRARYGRKEFAQYIGPKDKTYNLDKWGKSPDTNLLYISGFSGSGKSTLARNIANESSADYIQLDIYYNNPQMKSERSKHFDRFLQRTVPEYDGLTKNWSRYKDKRHDMESEESKIYWDTMDKVRDAISEYSKESYKSKKPVIAEGVQLFDYTMFPTRDELRKGLYGKPVIMKGTDPIISNLRQLKRDKVKITPRLVLERIKWYKPLQDSYDDVNKILRGD